MLKGLGRVGVGLGLGRGGGQPKFCPSRRKWAFGGASRARRTRIIYLHIRVSEFDYFYN